MIAKANEINPQASKRELDMLLSTGEQISIALCAMAMEKRGLPVVSLTAWQVGIQTNNTYTDARIGIGVIGLNSHLPSRQRNDRKAALFHRHGAQRNGNLLTRRQKHIQLALGSLRIDLVCFCDQIIGCVALRSVKSKLLKSLS